jgi:hypothetical protein
MFFLSSSFAYDDDQMYITSHTTLQFVVAMVAILL